MKRINKLIALFLTLLVFTACDKDEELLSINDKDIKTSVSVSTESLVLQKDNEVQEALTITMARPTFNVSVTPSYKLSLMIGEQKKNISLPTEKLEKVFSSVDLNKLVLDLGAVAEQETEVTIVGIVELGAKKVLSEKKIIKVTPYATKLDLTTTWGVVGSATPNGWNGPDLPFYKNTENAEEMVAYVTLADGEIKFRQNNTWGGDYGGSGELNGTLTTGPDNNIKVPAGTYKITINLTALTYKIEAFTWGIVGSATPNEWNGPDLPLEYSPSTDTWKAIVTLKKGDIKFRKNNTWGGDYGDIDKNGVLDTDNDNNIAVEAGNYLVEVNFKDLSYSITPTDIWGVVGSATPNQWNGPDIAMKMDFSKEGVWYVKGAVLTDGDIKFRKNNTWGGDYGDVDNDGVLDMENDNNIAVTAGTYDITVDFSNPDAPTYKLEKK